MDISSGSYYVYIGTYKNSKSKGIYIFNFDPINGKLEPKGTASELINPSYLCISSDRRYLYAVMEVTEYDGKNGGAVGAYTINKESGMLNLINMQPTSGKDPCHLCIDNSGKYLFIANYNEGTITEFLLGDKGELQNQLTIVRHEGNGPDKSRQEAPHMHYVSLAPDEKYLCAVDLGIDRVNVYGFNKVNGELTYENNLSVKIKPGSGPRHMTFSRDGRFAYLLTELSSEVIVFDIHSNNGRLNQLQCISTLPEGFEGKNYCAAIHLSSCGNFLYASNRGHDSLAVFNVCKTSGMIEPIAIIPALGQFPRDFAIDPTGRFLFAANQYSDNIVTFAILPETGKLEQTGDIIGIPEPACIKFVLLNEN